MSNALRQSHLYIMRMTPRRTNRGDSGTIGILCNIKYIHPVKKIQNLLFINQEILEITGILFNIHPMIYHNIRISSSQIDRFQKQQKFGKIFIQSHIYNT